MLRAQTSSGRAFVGLVALVAMLAVACGPEPDPLAGTYAVQGGGAALDVFNALKQEFAHRHPSVTLQFLDIGSTPGMRLVANGSSDLATTRAEPPSDIRDAVRLVSIGVSGTAGGVNTREPPPELKREQ